MLSNNISYTQLIYCFPSLERLLFRSRWYWYFFSFPSSERFWCLSRASFQSFSLFFVVFFFMFFNPFNIYTKKKKIIVILFFFNFLHQDFLHQNFFYQNQKKFYIIDNVPRDLFPLITYLHSSKNTSTRINRNQNYW